MEQKMHFVGIDVAKARVDVAVRPGGDIWSNENDEADIEELVVRLQTLGPAAVVPEATGGLEVPLVSALAAAALPVVVVNPRQVRDFANANGRSSTGSLGQDRRPGWPGIGPFRRGSASAGAAVTGRRYSGTQRHNHASQPDDDHAGGGEEPPGPGHLLGTSQHPGPHYLVGAGAQGPGQRSATDPPPESGMAREGRSAALGPRSWGTAVTVALGVSARVGHAEPQADRRLGRRGSHQPGHRSG